MLRRIARLVGIEDSRRGRRLIPIAPHPRCGHKDLIERRICIGTGRVGRARDMAVTPGPAGRAGCEKDEKVASQGPDPTTRKLQVDDSAAKSDRHSLGTILRSEFLKDALHMTFDGLFRD